MLFLPKSWLLPLIKAPNYNKKSKRWEIIFDNLDEGEYYLFFEPLG